MGQVVGGGLVPDPAHIIARSMVGQRTVVAGPQHDAVIEFEFGQHQVHAAMKGGGRRGHGQRDRSKLFGAQAGADTTTA